MFKENSKAIYLQIADRICNEVLAGKLAPTDRLPSVREYAATVQVNPNTMMRTYDHLASQGIIANKRGIGFFLTDEAPAIIRRLKSEELTGDTLRDLFGQLRLLGITPETLKEKYENYIKNSEK